MSVRNSSTNEKTIKSMYQMLPGDIWSIDKFISYGNYLGMADLIDGNILDNFRDYFELEEVDVPEKYFYQPAAFAEAVYGSPDLDFIVMYFANIPSMFEFNRKRIKFLPITKLVDLNKIAVKYKEEVEKSYKNPTQYVELQELELQKKMYI